MACAIWYINGEESNAEKRAKTSHLEVDDEFVICLCSHLPFELYLQDKHKETFVFKNTKK
jgi:hypothetical protein